MSIIRSFRVVALVVVLWLALGPVAGGSFTEAADTLKIAFVGPLTGSGSEDLHLAADAAKLAVKLANEKGGIKGKKVTLELGDDKADPKEAANLAAKYIADQDMLAVLHGWNSSPTIAAAPIFQKGKLSQVSYFAVSPKISCLSPYTFRTISTGALMAEYIANWVVKEAGHKKVASFYENTDYGKGLFDVFKKAVEKNGGQVIASEAHLMDNKDFSAIITKFKAANPDAVVMYGQYEAAAFWVKQSKDLGFKKPLYGSDGINAPALLSLAGADAEGIYSVTQYDPASNDPVVRNFLEAYKKEYGKPPSEGAGFAWDTANIVLAALDKGGPTREAVHKYLQGVKGFKGVTGTITFDKCGDRVLETGTYLKLQVKNGKFTRID